MENKEIKPDHYKSGKNDVIDFCNHHELDFSQGNVVKYVARAGKKPNVPKLVDYKKAREYIDRLIEQEEKEIELSANRETYFRDSCGIEHALSEVRKPKKKVNANSDTCNPPKI